MARMWILPLLTLGAASVITFVQGAIGAMATWTSPGSSAGDLWFPLLLLLVGAAGMGSTVRLTPAR